LKRNLKLVLEYDGSRFHGWQYQVGVRTVQGVLEEAIARLTGESKRVFAAGRTDAGVHALEQVVNFHTESSHAPEVFVRALNAILPGDVAVVACEEPEPKFNARSWAKGKIYRYLIYNRPRRRAFGHLYCWHIPEPLDIAAMKEAAKYLIGEHNFKSFQASGKDNEGKNPVREIRRIEINKTELGYLCFEFEAKSFLKQMVRNIVGTLVMAGRQKIRPEEIKQILESEDRRKAGPTAPSAGLYLVRVFY
jgi:tRNA pseudouridine38-40 synthase